MPVTSKLYFPASIIVGLLVVVDTVEFDVRSTAFVVITRGLTFDKEINITIAVIPFLMLFFKIINHSF